MESKKVVGIIPRLLFKLFLTLKEKFDPKPVITNEESVATSICEKLIRNTQSELIWSPLSNKRIIKNGITNVYVVLENLSVHIIDNSYSYSVYFQDTEKYIEMSKLFDQILENKRMELESEIHKNIQHSLETILKKLN